MVRIDPPQIKNVNDHNNHNIFVLFYFNILSNILLMLSLLHAVRDPKLVKKGKQKMVGGTAKD